MSTGGPPAGDDQRAYASAAIRPSQEGRLRKGTGLLGLEPSVKEADAVVTERDLARSIAAPRKPSAVSPMVDDFDHHDVPFTSLADDRVEEPPE